MKHPIIAITGASGSCYAIRLLEALIAQRLEPHVIISQAGRQVMGLELGTTDLKTLLGSDGWHEEAVENLSSPLASGSFPTSGMVVAPCSTGSLGAMANGVSSNLIHRAAEVTLKERRQLIVVPRETPFSQITLKNLLALSQAGADIVPACPGFYHNPNSIEDLVDFVVARVLDLMQVPHELSRRWSGTPVPEDALDRPS